MGRAGGGKGGTRPWNPIANPPGFPGNGRNQWWGGRPGFRPPFVTTWPYAGTFDTPLCASPLFPLAPDCSFGNAFGPPYYPYPPPPLNAPPAGNVIVMAPPQPAPPPVPITSRAGSGDLSNSSQASSSGYPTNSGEISKTGNADHQTLPVSSSAVQDKFPPVVVLKTGVYTVNKYWIKGKTLYFETTSGETRSAGLTLLERIAPAR
jgi:hypothetical protein